jgi:acyl-CoA thioesterase I
VSRKHLIAIAAVIAIVAAWLFWPSKYARVANLDSRGANVIAFGDSLTAGYGAKEGEDYPSRLAALLGTTVINAGVSGDTTAAALARVQADVLEQNPRIVIVGLGGNDFMQGVPLSATENNLREIVRTIRGAGAMVVLLGFRFPSLGASFEKMYERVAKEERCLLIPDLLDGILSNPSLKSDEIHPNARGYQMMAERVAGPVRKLMRRAGKKA